jgi:hypothetical protein
VNQQVDRLFSKLTNPKTTAPCCFNLAIADFNDKRPTLIAQGGEVRLPFK